MPAATVLDAGLAAGLIAGLSFVLTGLATAYARRSGLLDIPGARHSHDRVTPRGGGAGLVGAFLVGALAFGGPATPGWFLLGGLPGCVALAALGAWDDHRSLPVLPRFLVQLLVSLWLLGSFWALGLVTQPLVLVGATLVVIWMTNLYNFMDGSNGMAGLQGVFGGAVLAWLFARAGDPAGAWLGLALAAACLGFLPWNLGRARVFMGDVGSLALGFLFAAMLLAGIATQAFGPATALLVLSLFWVDATATLLARVTRGERWYTAHRQHVYQRLIAHGWSHGRVAALYQVLNLVLVLPGIGVAVRFPQWAWSATTVVLTLLVLGWYVLTRKFGVLAQAG